MAEESKLKKAQTEFEKKQGIICQVCKHYKKPKCELTNLFTARKESCSEWSKRK